MTPDDNESIRRPARWKRRLLALVVGLALAFAMLELALRVLHERPTSPFSYNIIIAKQTDHVDLFQTDGELGHALSGNRFVGTYEDRLVSIDEVCSDPRREGRRLVLNIGDSSTSGWNSDVVAENANRRERGEKLKSPLHTYPTYSAILAEREGLYVINAGVPGYTSMQVDMYVTRLLGQLHERGVPVSYVTVYVGNNDCTWNGNWEDAELSPGSFSGLRTLGLLQRAAVTRRVVPRVSTQAFAQHLQSIIATCRQYDTEVILVEPITPKLWPPGLRAKGLESEQLDLLDSSDHTRARDNLNEAVSLYLAGVQDFESGKPEAAAPKLEAAAELDFFVPRIKKAYREALRQVASDTGVPLIQVQEEVPVDDREFFIDYCHPIEPGNRLIADAISALIP